MIDYDSLPPYVGYSIAVMLLREYGGVADDVFGVLALGVEPWFQIDPNHGYSHAVLGSSIASSWAKICFDDSRTLSIDGELVLVNAFSVAAGWRVVIDGVLPVPIRDLHFCTYDIIVDPIWGSDLAPPINVVRVRRVPVEADGSARVMPAVVPKMRLQEERLLQIVASLGYDPRRLPPFNPGKPWVKAQVKPVACKEPRMFGSGDVVDAVWDRLRGDGRIAEER